MSEITLSELKAEDFELFQTITVETPAGLAQLVWDSRRLPAVLDRGQADDLIAARPRDLIQTATIKVMSLNATEIKPVFAKIEALDTHARRRIVRAG